MEEIEKLHQSLNDPEFIEEKLYKRNAIGYEFVSYINHIIACYYSKNYNVMVIFLRRATKFLNSDNKKYLNNKYLNIAESYINTIHSYILNLNDKELTQRINSI